MQIQFTRYVNQSSAFAMKPGVNLNSGKEDNIFFNSLYDKYSGPVMGFIVRNTDTLPEAENILIKVFLHVWAEIKTFNEQDNNLMRIIKIAAKLIYIRKQDNHSFG